MEDTSDVIYRRKGKSSKQKIVFAFILTVFLVFVVSVFSLHAQFAKRNEMERWNVIIYAPARTGSSFLGEIFNQHEDVFYLYEPLYTYSVLNKLRVLTNSQQRHQSKRLIRDALQCNFTNHELYLSFISHPDYASTLFRDSSKAMSTPPLCEKRSRKDEYIWSKRSKRACSRLEPKKTNLACKNHKQVTVKVLSHRIRLADILNSNLTNVKVIYLLRDPRAVIASRLQLGWISEKSVKIQEFCSRMKENLEVVTNLSSRISKNCMILRYEDLVANVFSVVGKIFKVTGLHLRESVENWLFENTRWSGKVDQFTKTDPFGTTKRNAKVTANLWRRNISTSIVREVERKCEYAMKEAGYRKLEDNYDLKYAPLLVRPTERINQFLV